MTTSNLIRWSGLAAILAGLSSIAASFLQPDGEPPLLAWVLVVNGLAILFALIGVYAYQVAESGVWGLLGFVSASVGNALILGSVDGDPGVVAGAFVALGIVLLGIGSWRAGKLPRWVPVLWFFAVLIGFPGFFIESLMSTLFLVGQIAYGLGFIAAGYALWSQKDAMAEQLSAV